MRQLISLVVGLAMAAMVGCSGGGSSTEDIVASVQAGVVATQEARPTATPMPTMTPVPTPSPTAVPEYTPELADFITALGDRYVSGPRSFYLDRYNGFATVYFVESLLKDVGPTSDGFQSFVQTNIDRYIGFVARDQLKEIGSLFRGTNPLEWVVIVADPTTELQSEIACQLALASRLAGISPLLSSSFPAPDCPVLFAEYRAAGNSDSNTYLEYLDNQGYW